MWTDDVDVNIVSSSHYYVLAFVVNRATAVSFNLVCMYGDPHHQHTNDIWHDVEAFVVQSQDSPTLCIGDLNNIMHPVRERIGENNSLYSSNPRRVGINSTYTWASRWASNTWAQYTATLMNKFQQDIASFVSSVMGYLHLFSFFVPAGHNCHG